MNWDRLRLRLLVAGLLACWPLCEAAPLAAQPKAPPPPETFDAVIHYRIRADRQGRIRHFVAMTGYFGKLGFEEAPTEDSDLAISDPEAEHMVGTIPSANARKLLLDPRVLSVLLTPSGFAPPEGARVPVLIELAGGFPPAAQQRFARQVSERLGLLGFREWVAYDNRGYSILRGTIPADSLPLLLKDLRTEPSGWLLPETPPEELPAPLRQVWPIRVVEVQPVPEGAPAPAPPAQVAPPVPPDRPLLRKLTPALRTVLANEAARGRPLRVQILFAREPGPEERLWSTLIQGVSPGTRIEGRVGPLVTVLVPRGSEAEGFAELDSVISVRLPRSGEPPVRPAAPPAKEPLDGKEEAPKADAGPPKELPPPAPVPEVLRATHLDRFHATGRLGAGVRAVLIDGDFNGYAAYVGKGLPERTRFVDLTAERNPSIEPDPPSADGRIGHGTHCALAFALAAPDAELTLIRIDPAAAYMLLDVARYVRGEAFRSEAIRVRREELEADAGNLQRRRAKRTAEYLEAFSNFGTGEEPNGAKEEPEVDVDNPQWKPAKNPRVRRERAAAQMRRQEVEERAYMARLGRLEALERALVGLRGTQVVVCPLGWNTGFPLDGTSPLSRYLDAAFTPVRPRFVVNASQIPKPPVWFVAAGDTRGQSWTGLFRDLDNNGVMEFAAPGTPLRPGRWSPELNFLAFRNWDGSQSLDLPAGARLRVTIQWREPHDPTLPDPDDTAYRLPLAPLGLMLLRQRDPSGKALPADEMEPVARTEGQAIRLDRQPNSGAYEHFFEVTLPASGRYALRVEGGVPNSTRPASSPIVPALEKVWELRPRIFIEVLDGPTAVRGRPVFLDYESLLGGMAVPADARSVLAVGSAHLSRRPEPTSALGAGPNTEMRLKPDVLAFDQLPRLGNGTGPAWGTSLSASFAGGMGTSLIGAGAPQSWFLESLRIPPGHVLEVPEFWIPKRP